MQITLQMMNEWVRDVREWGIWESEGCERVRDVREWEMWASTWGMWASEGCERVREWESERCERVRDVREWGMWVSEGCEWVRDVRNWRQDYNYITKPLSWVGKETTNLQILFERGYSGGSSWDSVDCCTEKCCHKTPPLHCGGSSGQQFETSSLTAAVC